MSDNSSKRRKVTQELLDKEAVTTEEKAKALQSGIFNVGKKQAFVGSILQCMNITYTHILPTAAVAFNGDNKRWDMYINPYFFCKKLSPLHQEAVLLHEISHVLHKHPMRVPFIKLSPRKRRLMNIAADMAINQGIPNLPRGCQQCPPRDAQGNMTAPCPNEMCPGWCIDIDDYYDEDQKTKARLPWAKGQTMEFYY